MHKEEYSALDGLGLAQLIKQGEVTPTEYSQQRKAC